MSNPDLAAQAISLNSVVVVAPEQVSSELVGESIILNLKTGMYYGLNEVGASVWQLIQTPQTVKDICESILQEYDVDASECETEIFRLLNDLCKAQLISVKDAATA